MNQNNKRTKLINHNLIKEQKEKTQEQKTKKRRREEKRMSIDSTTRRYTIDKVLSMGQERAVYRGRDHKTNQIVAMKIMDKAVMNDPISQSLAKEIRIMRSIQHQHILRLKALVNDTMLGNKNVSIMIYEFAEGGELFEYLFHTNYFEERLARTYFFQLINALRHCHDKKICHRNIKPENILLDSDFKLKLSDFNMAAILDDENEFLYEQSGSRAYVAPEVMAGHGYQGCKADVWSAGVVLFIMLCGTLPFTTTTSDDWWFSACMLARYDRFWAAHLRSASHMSNSPLAQDLLNKIFVPNPEHRISLHNILRHEWMSGPVLSDVELKDAMRERQVRIELLKNETPPTTRQLLPGLASSSKNRKRSRSSTEKLPVINEE